MFSVECLVLNVELITVLNLKPVTINPELYQNEKNISNTADFSNYFLPQRPAEASYGKPEWALAGAGDALDTSQHFTMGDHDHAL
jgi:hypothetical protein